MKLPKYLGKILVGVICFGIFRALPSGAFIDNLGGESAPMMAQRGLILLLIVVAVLMIVATLNIFKR